MKNHIKSHWQKISIFLLALLAGTALYLSISDTPEGQVSYVEVDGKKVEVELAQSAEEKIKGLSGRSSLAQGSGMLFVFEEKDRLSFWMKDMNFDLDFIWIADDTIVDVHKNVPAPSSNSGTLETYSPSVPADKILEVNAGWIEENFGNADLRGKKINIFTQ